MGDVELEENWKDKYFKSLLAQEDAEQAYIELFNQLYKELLYAFEYFRGYNQTIDSLLSSLPSKPGPEELPISQIKDLNRQIADHEAASEVSAANSVDLDANPVDISDFALARDSLEYLLDRLPEESFSQLDLARLNVSLTEAEDFSQLCVVIDGFKDVLSALLEERNKKISELSSFLADVSTRLDGLQNFLVDEKSERQTSQNEREDLTKKVNTNLRQIRQSISENQQLKQLQSVIETQITEIDDSVSSFVEAETIRANKAEKASAQLQVQIQQLENKSEQLSKSLEAARTDSIIDPLTGVSNRRAYDERFIIEYARWKRSREPLTLAIMDIDNFKKINDTYGHPVGDKVLKVVASRIQQQIRESDFFGRIGGEEFAFLIVNCNLEDSLVKVESLRKSVEACNFRIKDSKFQVSISSGLASFEEKDTVNIVYARADQALLKAKQEGRNRTIIG